MYTGVLSKKQLKIQEKIRKDKLEQQRNCKLIAALTDQEELFKLACKLISFDNKSHKRNTSILGTKIEYKKKNDSELLRVIRIT